MIYRSFGKRCFDCLLALLMFGVMLPVLGCVWLAVRLRIGAPALFVQARVGLNGRIFQVVKFRTMNDSTDEAGMLRPDADRLVPLGRALRQLSLDELPELWNVVRGDMSMVGPRPLLVQYLERYSPVQARRHEVRPGLTGWAQVNGRNHTSWEQRLQQDVWYVDHMSAWLDVKILFMTLWQVMARKGISAPGNETMPEFRGHDERPGGGGV